MILSQWTNPFAKFLGSARSKLLNIQGEPEVRTDASLLPRFVRIIEDRNFVFDIVDRVESLAVAFDRLRELYESYVQFDGERKDLIERDPGAPSTKVPDEPGKGMDRCHRESQALVTFVYYEYSTLVQLLKKWLSPTSNGYLEYLIGVRDKILTHPRKDARIKNSASALTIGPVLIAHLVGAESWNPLIRDWYLNELTAQGITLDDKAGADANVALIRDKKRWSDGRNGFTPKEILQLHSYIIPEPDLLQSTGEMASLLESKFLPEITRACTERVR